MRAGWKIGCLPLRLHHIVFDAHDPPGLARFWAGVQGWRILSEREREVVIGPDEAAPVGICFMPVTEGKPDEPRTGFHPVCCKGANWRRGCAESMPAEREAYLNYFRYAWSMPAQTFPYSSFLRGPSQVLPSLADADVILERRDEENLVLTRAERFDAVATGLRIAARSLAILARRHRDLAEEAFAEELPWLTWLPVEERPACVRELLADLVAGADTGLLVPFARNLASWRSTAEAWSDPRLARELRGPFDGDGPTIGRPVQDVA